jgi:hypothetical protein
MGISPFSSQQPSVSCRCRHPVMAADTKHDRRSSNTSAKN